MRHITKWAAPRAHVAEYHESRSTFAETLADIRAGSLLAHRVQIMLAQHALHVVITLAAAGLHPYPFRLAQALLQRHDLDRVARRFGGASLFVFSIAHDDFLTWCVFCSLNCPQTGSA
jgi:hypothetical protein